MQRRMLRRTLRALSLPLSMPAVKERYQSLLPTWRKPDA
jgi:hypothetical protein